MSTKYSIGKYEHDEMIAELTRLGGVAFAKGRVISDAQTDEMLARIVADIHPPSTRPCETCRKISAVLSEPYWCLRVAIEAHRCHAAESPGCDMTHTHGPWKLSKSGLSVESEQREGIASTGTPNGTIELSERQANARLIAAAPDLLAACKLIVSNHQHAGGSISEAQLDWCRAAVAKATPKT